MVLLCTAFCVAGCQKTSQADENTTEQIFNNQYEPITLGVDVATISSDTAKRIVEKYDLDIDNAVEGKSADGTKIVVYNSVVGNGIDEDGMYYTQNGTPKGVCKVCEKPFGEGTEMCSDFCGVFLLQD